MKSKKLVILTLAMTLCLTANLVCAGNLVIKGSTTVLPIAQKVAEVYMKQHPDVKISISGGGSGNGIKALIDGSTDIADSSRFIKPKEVKLAVENGEYPVPFAVAYDCIVPVVHPTNSVVNLTMAQLKAIYKGEVKNWKEVGGPDRPIVVISRDTSSGTYEVWSEKVMKNERVFPGALLQASNGAIVQAVAKNKNAIGYIGIGYMDKSVKALMVDRPKGDTLKFINFVVHPEKGQKYVSEAGYVPLY